MLKLRLKRIGRKRLPFYRLVVINNTSRRNGQPIDEIGYYDPINKKYKFDKNKIEKWLAIGVKPTKIVYSLLKKANIII